MILAPPPIALSVERMMRCAQSARDAVPSRRDFQIVRCGLRVRLHRYKLRLEGYLNREPNRARVFVFSFASRV